MDDAKPLCLASSVRTRVEETLSQDRFVGGWMVAGAPQIGKRRLATALARGLLSGSGVLDEADATTGALIANRSHPDLFILEREANEKTGKMRQDISVDQVRRVSAGLHRTATSGRRVVIIDLADHLGREGANALLKTLEEPPAGTTLLLLTVAPGRLLPTIRSRCRTLTLPPVADEEIAAWAGADRDIVAEAGGRPGRALALLSGESEAARALSEDFFAALADPRSVALHEMAQRLAAPGADAPWADVRVLILDRLSRRLRSSPTAPNTPALVEAYDHALALSARAEALNSDKQHTIFAMASSLQHAGAGELL